MRTLFGIAKNPAYYPSDKERVSRARCHPSSEFRRDIGRDSGLPRPCPRCTVQRGQNVLHLRILVYSMLVRTIINDRDLVTLAKNRHTPLTFYIGFVVFRILFKVRRKKGNLYARGYNDTIVSGVLDKLGEDNLHKERSNAHTLPI